MAASPIILEDIAHIIVKELESSPAALASAALISRVFRAPCQKRLFHTIHVHSRPQSWLADDGYAKMQHLALNPHLASYVNDFALHFDSAPRTDTFNHYHAISATETLPRLVHLKKFELTFNYKKHQAWTRLDPCLKSFVADVCLGPQSGLSHASLFGLLGVPLRILTRCPALEYLDLLGITLEAFDSVSEIVDVDAPEEDLAGVPRKLELSSVPDIETLDTATSQEDPRAAPSELEPPADNILAGETPCLPAMAEDLVGVLEDPELTATNLQIEPAPAPLRLRGLTFHLLKEDPHVARLVEPFLGTLKYLAYALPQAWAVQDSPAQPIPIPPHVHALVFCIVGGEDDSVDSAMFRAAVGCLEETPHEALRDVVFDLVMMGNGPEPATNFEWLRRMDAVLAAPGSPYRTQVRLTLELAPIYFSSPVSEEYGLQIYYDFFHDEVPFLRETGMFRILHRDGEKHPFAEFT